MTINREDFIKEFSSLAEKGEITDIERFAYENDYSRTKAKKELLSGGYAEVKIRKHFLYVKR